MLPYPVVVFALIVEFLRDFVGTGALVGDGDLQHLRLNEAEAHLGFGGRSRRHAFPACELQQEFHLQTVCRLAQICRVRRGVQFGTKRHPCAALRQQHLPA
jgi:hypothetical protein